MERKRIKSITLTSEEAYQLSLERNYIHYREIEPTPVMDKMRRAGVNPLAYDLRIQVNKEKQLFTYSVEVKYKRLFDRICEAIAEFFRPI